jgi:glycosyltransferase involved in cell wall biosynthesis
VGYISGLLAQKQARPSIVTLVGNDIKKYIFSPEKVGVCQSGLEKADRVAALSRDLVEMAHSLVPIDHKARIIYNSVDIPAGEWKPHKRPNGLYRIGCAGIFKYAKGLPYLFKALALLATGRKLVLELVGDLRESERDTFEIMVQRTGISEFIQFLDPMPHEGIFDWLRSLDLYVLPSVSEGCPNILMEAMAAGVPCVATCTGAAGVLVDDHISGLLVPWGDSYALAEAIAEIMDNPGRAAGFGSAAREKMRQFSGQRERSAWEALYRELIDF